MQAGLWKHDPQLPAVYGTQGVEIDAMKQLKYISGAFFIGYA
jgi:hypothetical protein